MPLNSRSCSTNLTHINIQMSVMRRRVFLVEKFIHMLIVIRLFTTHLFPLIFFVPFIFIMLVAQYIKEGFTPLLLALLPLIAVQVFAEINGMIQLQYLVAIMGGILHFIPLRFYWLPDAGKLVGFKEDSLEGGLHYVEFHPLDQTEAITKSSIRWHLRKEVSKMLEHKSITNRVAKKIGHFVMSYIDHYNIKLGIGKEKITDFGIAFSHGRGATPLIYSSYLIHFAGLGFRVGSVQHSEVIKTKLEDRDEIKRFRQREVQARAAEFYQTVLKVDKSRLILMGHSYGCATVIQAYHSLQPELKAKVSQIVLLDPWFFPLTNSKMNQKIKCPILILANEDFVRNPDIYERNLSFLNQHKSAEYILWKEGHHLHQTDMGFINGNFLGAIKNSHLTRLMLDLNISAIERFLKGEKVEGTFGDRDLGRNYKPERFYPLNEFSL